MRITSLALAFFVTASLGMIGCDRSEVEPAAGPTDTEPTEGDIVVVEPGVPTESPSPGPESGESEPSGLAMPADAPSVDGDPEIAANDEPLAAPEPLNIGSQAPPLDIEHWIQDGNGKYEPVTEFEEGNVYIVEFWATWCGPCISSMPHLAEIQQQYADQGVRLISVSDEPLQTVEQFLDREVPSSQTPAAEEEEAGDEEGADEEAAEGEEEVAEEETQTYRDLTSVYSLTTDPDRSTHAAYMEAANQTGIPTAFIVGKTGEVEWIGHPMTMDEPLEEILNDSWDRAAYAQQMELKSQIGQAQNMIRRGQMEEGLALVNQLIDEIEDPDLLLNVKFFKLQALIAMQDQSEEVATLAADLLDIAAEQPPQVMSQLSWVIYQATQTTELPQDLLETTIAAAEKAVEELDEDQRPSMLDTLAHLHEANGDLDAAIAAQQEAVDLSEGRMQERLQQYLDELKALKEAGEAEPEQPAEESPEEADAANPEEAADEAASETPEVVEEVTEPETSEAADDAGEVADPNE